MATSTSDFATLLSAGMAGVSVEDYNQRQQWMLDNLDKIEEWVGRVKITDAKTFELANAYKSALCSLSCHTFNTRHPENDRVWNIESVLGKKMKLYVSRNLAPSEENRMIRYILSNRCFYNDADMRKKILDHLVEKGYVFIRPATEYDCEKIFVTGIACKTGDNTFTISGRDRHHRQYMSHCGFQCYALTWDKDEEYLQTKSLPRLEKEMTLAGYGDGKYLARHPKFNRREFDKLRSN